MTLEDGVLGRLGAEWPKPPVKIFDILIVCFRIFKEIDIIQQLLLDTNCDIVSRKMLHY